MVLGPRKQGKVFFYCFILQRWGGRCVGVWLGWVCYFEIKSTGQCRRSSSEPVGTLSVAFTGYVNVQVSYKKGLTALLFNRIPQYSSIEKPNFGSRLFLYYALTKKVDFRAPFSFFGTFCPTCPFFSPPEKGAAEK